MYDNDIANGRCNDILPHALERKYPAAMREWGWQWVFPSDHLSKDRTCLGNFLRILDRGKLSGKQGNCENP